MRFTKMQGCGNDYIYIDGFQERVDHPEELAIAMSERHFGIGADGLVLILPSGKADFRMQMFNLDGSEAQMCGNAIRCIGKYVYERQMTAQTKISVETKSGIRYLDLEIEGDEVTSVTVDMGVPVLEGNEIPVAKSGRIILDLPLQVNGDDFLFTCVSMGNPHAVTFVSNIDEYPVEYYGSKIEVNPMFPQKVNVEFVEVVDESHIKMRVWERGSGETLACGTGACAAVVACVLNGQCGRRVHVELSGGTLSVYWSEEDNHVYMSGSAAFSFDGVWLKDI